MLSLDLHVMVIVAGGWRRKRQGGRLGKEEEEGPTQTDNLETGFLVFRERDGRAHLGMANVGGRQEGKKTCHKKRASSGIPTPVKCVCYLKAFVSQTTAVFVGHGLDRPVVVKSLP